MRIVVLAGGWSPERNVSLTSGTKVANALIRKGHRVLLLDLYCGLSEGKGLFFDDLYAKTEYPIPKIEETVPDLEKLKHDMHDPKSYIGPEVLRLCAEADVVFLALHGGMGENGQIQATLDSLGITYTGSGYVGSLLAMNKGLSKEILKMHGVRVPEGIVLKSSERDRFDRNRVRFPCVVKPSSCGSSVGVSLLDSPDELDDALDEAFAWCDEVIIEDRIYGRELTMAVLNGEALPPVEIRPKAGFYDYRNKYQSGMTEEICPAPLNSKVLSEMERVSLRAFELLKLKGYARFDLMMDKEEKLWILEANTLPGMTELSLLPRMAEARGISYDELCDLIARSACWD
ncbi:MAG: D-alanine--D-alanine ligase [Clostridia bacterium]|nr:D-alanine--D-alanine ligase [Clostridia bacterium]